jgi:hypothetical protein
MLRDGVRVPEIREAFDEGLLKPLTFERKINVAILVAPKILAEEDASAFKAELNDLRSLRNAMAHNPFWFHPELNQDGQVVNLVPMIMLGKNPLPLTTAFVEKANVQIGGLIERSAKMAAAAARMHPAALSEPEES